MTSATADLPAVVPDTRSFPDPLPRRKWGLRRRILLIFTLGALMLSVVLAFVTYGLARSSVVQQQDEAAREVARRNATNAAELLRSNPDTAQATIDRLVDAMRFRTARQGALAANVVNADTPGYRRVDVEFQDILQRP